MHVEHEKQVDADRQAGSMWKKGLTVLIAEKFENAKKYKNTQT